MRLPQRHSNRAQGNPRGSRVLSGGIENEELGADNHVPSRAAQKGGVRRGVDGARWGKPGADNDERESVISEKRRLIII